MGMRRDRLMKTFAEQDCNERLSCGAGMSLSNGSKRSNECYSN
jgi:hypothetical protein